MRFWECCVWNWADIWHGGCRNYSIIYANVLEIDKFDLILADYSLSEFDGIAALDIARIQVLLELQGTHVIAVATAGEALVTLPQFKPNILLSDIGMPNVDGYMLMRQVRTLPAEQGGTTPAIALTAYAGELDYRQAMLAGFQRHISKPVNPTELVEAIASLCT